MSGLKNEPVTGGKFLNFKDGKIISAVSGTKEEYTSIEGTLFDLDIVDEEYKGKEYRKIVLFIKDNEGNEWKLGFPLESGYGNAFCSLALSVDYSKPVKISGGVKEMENNKSYGMLFIKQPVNQPEGEWKNLKWYYTKESTEVPKGVKSKDRSGEFLDFSERNDFYHRMLIDTIRPAIISGGISGGAKSTQTATTTKATTKKK
jgi:hypothetical protein